MRCDPRITPTRNAISRPPTAASTSTGSAPRSGSPFASRPRRTAPTLRAMASSSRPVPRPHTSDGSAGSSAAVKALAAVVFPIPISPRPTISMPSWASSVATAIPRSIAPIAVGRDMAGPCVRSSVPRTPSTISTLTPATSGASVTPASTTRRRAPASRASTQMAAPPFAKLASICAVTSGGYALTPCAATPWSAAATTIAGRSGPSAPNLGSRRAGTRAPRAARDSPAASSSRPAGASSRPRPPRPRGTTAAIVARAACPAVIGSPSRAAAPGRRLRGASATPAPRTTAFTRRARRGSVRASAFDGHDAEPDLVADDDGRRPRRADRGHVASLAARSRRTPPASSTFAPTA